MLKQWRLFFIQAIISGLFVFTLINPTFINALPGDPLADPKTDFTSLENAEGNSPLGNIVESMFQQGRDSMAIKNPSIGLLGNSATNAENGSIFFYYFVYLWRVIMTVGGLFVLIYFLMGAIEWINAGGDSSKIQKARDRIVQSFIGLIVLVFSLVIIGFISRLVFADQFNILSPSIPTISSE